MRCLQFFLNMQPVYSQLFLRSIVCQIRTKLRTQGPPLTWWKRGSRCHKMHISSMILSIPFCSHIYSQMGVYSRSHIHSSTKSERWRRRWIGFHRRHQRLHPGIPSHISLSDSEQSKTWQWQTGEKLPKRLSASLPQDLGRRNAFHCLLFAQNGDEAPNDHVILHCDEDVKNLAQYLIDYHSG